MVCKLQTVNRGKEFLHDTEKLAQRTQYTPQDDDLSFENNVNMYGNKFEIFLFANYDICNFTRYKRNNKNWIILLQKFIFSGINSSTEWPMQFWKFNGDSITYRKKIQSIDELCRFIKKAYVRLENFEKVLNMDSTINETVFIRGSIWISGFKGKSCNDYIANNATFLKKQFGQEFVGENIDEGFRLSSCSKASNLAVDPKIVYILNLYDQILSKNCKECPSGFSEDDFNRFLQTKIDVLNGSKYSSARKIIEDTIKKLYLMEYQKCKGVWNDRSYPIFWYIEDINKKKFVYDEIVDGKILLEHKINSYLEGDISKEFSKRRVEIANICFQVGIIETIRSLLMNLDFFPYNPSSGELVFDTAKLYYMIACVIENNSSQQGILIFKRSNNRHHLKNVWDLIPIKHARMKINSSTSVVEDYLKQMLIKELNLDNNNDLNIKHMIRFYMDKKRGSVKPWALCNIYRNGEVHNGILCAASIDIGDLEIDDFIAKMKKGVVTIENNKYSDIKLVTYDEVSSCSDESAYDYFTVDNIKIRTLSLEEVSDNSNEVCNNFTYESIFDVLNNETEYGVSYLGYSIKQILSELI